MMIPNGNRNSWSNSNRSNTLPHNQSGKGNRNSQSHSKQNLPNNTSNNHIPKPILTPITEQNFIDKPFSLAKGNNMELVRRILCRRKGWGEVQNNQFALFRWWQVSNSFKFHTLGKQCLSFNHMEYHRELSNKQKLVQNMINFCEANKINAYGFIPVTYILDLTTGEEDLALHSFIKFYNRNYPGQNNPNTTNKRYQTVILPRNKYNPYLSAQQLNKRSQGNFYCKPYCPKTFVDEDSKAYLWILKPAFLNRGRGVVLFKELEQLQKLIWKYYEGEGLEDYGQKYQIPQKIETESMIEGEGQKKEEVQEKKVEEDNENQKKEDTETNIENKEQEKKKSQVQNPPSKKQINLTASEPIHNNFNTHNQQSKVSLPRCMSFIIQKYIEQPMLIENKKFDIRVWALLNQSLQVFFFEEGYLRFSSQPYSTKNNHMNPFIHLTNNSVQKYCQEYDKTSGNQLALSDLVKYLPHSKATSIFAGIKAKIKQIIWLSMCSVRRKINVNARKDCFELLGYDFMIDKDYKVWLIEINSNPAIDESGTLLKVLLPRMLDDMFKITIDRIFSNRMKDEVQELSVEGFDDDHNMWEYVGDLKEGANDRNNGRRLTFARR